MSRESGPSVYQYNNQDCWRTWFLEECEAAGLYGVTIGHLKYIKGVPYQSGTIIYLEDAPYFHEHKIHHRVCGPYEVVATTQLPADGKSIHIHNNQVIVYEESRPKLGPWLNRTMVRVIEGVPSRIKQMASNYEYFPLRFKIKPHKDHDVVLETHEVNCTLCSKRYDNSVFNKKKPLRNEPRAKLIKNK